MSSKRKPITEICILAGGLSRRMRGDKARLRLGGQTLLGIIRAAAKRTRCGVRVIRRDLVPRCGPLGGVLTALKTSAAERVLFLACDMPFVSPELLREILKKTPSARAMFVIKQSRVGFPFVLPVATCECVQNQIDKGELSLQELAQRLRALKFKVPRRFSAELENLNTPAKYQRARKLWPAR